MISRRAFLAAALIVAAVFGTLPAAAETSVGLTAGAALAGNQDFGVNLLPPRPQGRRVHKDLSADTGALVGLTVTEWPDTWRWFGVGADASWWNTPVTVRRGLRSFDLGQTRSALLVQPLARYRITDEIFFYGGLGGGFAYTTVRHGSDRLGPAIGALTGIAIPLTQSVRLRFEAQYLATHDADAARRPNQRIDVSGNPRGNPAHVLFGPHLDTQFVPLRVSLEWVFR
jgi:hypothetical protein